jgi:phage N-6-adenine-methyltransferase
LSNSEWATPQSLFDKLNVEFGFELDVCANADNAKCSRYFTREQDGLSQDWIGVVWMNPPYGRGIEGWMSKALEASRDGATVVALIPSRTNAPWWHDYVMNADEIRFIRKKVSFGGRVDGVPFTGSVIAVFRPIVKGQIPKLPRVSSYTQDGHRGGNGRRRTTPRNAKLGKPGSRAPRTAGSNPADDHQSEATGA